MDSVEEAMVVSTSRALAEEPRVVTCKCDWPTVLRADILML